MEISAWVTDAGLTGTAEAELVRGFCERVNAAGLPVSRATVVIDTLHPVHEGRVFPWRRDEDREMIEYGRISGDAQALENWRRSPFFHMLETGDSMLRRNLATGDAMDFPILPELHEQGQTDYLALIHRFTEAGSLGDMDCVYSSWISDAPKGFADGQADTLCRLVPSLALAVKCASLLRIAGTLVETYLGRDAGRRVLQGRIVRGVADRVRAVLWYSDLRGFTHVTDTAPPDQIIPFLNDYAEATISAIQEAGGDVLKLIGDGTLAIFTADDPGRACRGALEAEANLRSGIADLNSRRASDNLPTTDAYVGLHLGDVFFGNIGSQNRLDFTVIGPAVNMASRIATMCRSVERNVLLSSAFLAATPEQNRAEIVSVGRYALRGFDGSQELFTLERSSRIRSPA
jgi:adenylate cyclase